MKNTYADWQSEHIWESLFVMSDLFRRTGRCVAEHFGFNYPEQDDKNVTDYLHHIRELPENADLIY